MTTEHTCFNDWFLAQSDGRQAVLRDDKWMLAHAAYDAGRAARAQAPAAVEPVAADDFHHEQMDALALARYKVVPSDQSMFWRYAVVSGDGQRHLYNGSEVDCQNMARKFAGAFLDGAFVYQTRYAAHNATKAEPAPDAQATKDAQLWRDHVGKLDALVTYCPTCCEGFTAKAEMSRDEVIFECSKTVGRGESRRFLAALQTAVDHIDMAALRISHCKDAAAIDAAMAAQGAKP